MPKHSKKTKKPTTYKRKPGAFDRFTCSQVDTKGVKILEDQYLDVVDHAHQKAQTKPIDEFL
jgi:hypothetical protein